MSIMNTLALQPANAAIKFNLENLMQKVNEMISAKKVTLQPKEVFTGAQLSRIQNLKRYEMIFRIIPTYSR